MLQLTGTYHNGKVHLEKVIPTDHPVKVTVLFEEEVESEPKKSLQFSDFSFAKSREILKHTKGSLSDTVIEERRDSL